MEEVRDKTHSMGNILEFIDTEIARTHFNFYDLIFGPYIKLEAQELGLSSERIHSTEKSICKQIETTPESYFEDLLTSYIKPHDLKDNEWIEKYITTINELIKESKENVHVRPMIKMVVSGNRPHAILSPPGFKHTLYDCQSRLLEKTLNVESDPVVKFRDVVYKSNAGRISERMSFGKTVMLCALISMKPDCEAPEQTLDNCKFVGQHFNYNQRKYIPLNIIVAEGKTIDQWEEYILKFTSLSSMTVGTKTQLEKFDKLLHSSPDKLPCVILVKNSKLKAAYTPINGKVFEITFEGSRSSVGVIADILDDVYVSRVIFDDFDILQLPNDATLPRAKFTWYVSATKQQNYQASFEKRVNIRSVKCLSEDPLLVNFNLKCTLDVVQSSLNNVKINAYWIDTRKYSKIKDMYHGPSLQEFVTLSNEQLTEKYLSNFKKNFEMIVDRKCSKCSKEDYWNYMCNSVYLCVDCYNNSGLSEYDFYVKQEGKKKNIIFSKEIYPPYLKNTAEEYMKIITSTLLHIKNSPHISLLNINGAVEIGDVIKKFKNIVPGKRDEPLCNNQKPKVIIYNRNLDKNWHTFFAQYLTEHELKTTVYDDDFDVKDFESNDDFAFITRKTIAGLNMEYITHIIGFSNYVDEDYEQIVGRAYRITRKNNLTILNFSKAISI